MVMCLGIYVNEEIPKNNKILNIKRFLGDFEIDLV